jgi:hypothetical protein
MGNEEQYNLLNLKHFPLELISDITLVMEWGFLVHWGCMITLPNLKARDSQF